MNGSESFDGCSRCGFGRRAAKHLLVLTLALAFGLRAGAALLAGSADAEFEKGNELYEKGQYTAAAAEYEKLLQSGKVSAAVQFNLGNALFKSGQVGRAILNYRLAALLAPRDPDIRANLQFARNTVQTGSVTPGAWWQRAIQRLTLNEWTMLTTAALWVWFVLLALGQWRRSLSRSLRRPVVTAGVAFTVSAICLVLAWNSRFGVRWALVVTPEAVIRNGPLDESPTYYVVRDGAELQVLDSKSDWLQVTDAARRTGWLRRQQVVTIGDGG